MKKINLLLVLSAFFFIFTNNANAGNCSGQITSIETAYTGKCAVFKVNVGSCVFYTFPTTGLPDDKSYGMQPQGLLIYAMDRKKTVTSWEPASQSTFQSLCVGSTKLSHFRVED